MNSEQKGLRIDIGCGSAKKEGTIGIDHQALPGVDYVLDLLKKPLPFQDSSVAYVHSSHFLEHIEDPTNIYSEISRVCQHNARLELWTPYAWSNSAFIIDHKFFFAEDIYLHMCLWFNDFWEPILKGRWILNEVQYCIDPSMLAYLRHKDLSLDFAVRHLHNVVREFCVHVTVIHEKPYPSPSLPRRTFSTGRLTPRYEIKPDESTPIFGLIDLAADQLPNEETQKAVRHFAKSGALPQWE